MIFHPLWGFGAFLSLLLYFYVPSACVDYFQLLVSENDFWQSGVETSPHLLHPAGFQLGANTEITPGDIKRFESVCSRAKYTVLPLNSTINLV